MYTNTRKFTHAAPKVASFSLKTEPVQKRVIYFILFSSIAPPVSQDVDSLKKLETPYSSKKRVSASASPKVISLSLNPETAKKLVPTVAAPTVPPMTRKDLPSVSQKANLLKKRKLNQLFPAYHPCFKTRQSWKINHLPCLYRPRHPKQMLLENVTLNHLLQIYRPCPPNQMLLENVTLDQLLQIYRPALPLNFIWFPQVSNLLK